MAEETNATLKEPEEHIIITDRLRLRTLRVSDAERMMPILTKDEVMRWTSHGAMSGVSQAERWVKDRALGADIFNFAIELKEPETSDTSDKPSPPAIIGVVGSFHLPEIGYMIHPDHAGNGYATEALQAVLPQLFDRVPTSSEGGTGFDHLEGWTDVQNWPSRRILEKCGFTYCEMIPDPDNAVRGPSSIAVFRKARPGKSLAELGLLVDEQSEPPPPPLQ